MGRLSCNTWQDSKPKKVSVVLSIPAPIHQVRIAATASPSLLSRANSCAMRVFGRDKETGSFLPQLIAGPYVEIGTLIHKAIELANNSENIEEVFEKLLDKRIKELELDDRRNHYSNLQESLGSRYWAKRLEIILASKGILPAVDFDEVIRVETPKTRQNFNPKDLDFPSVSMEVPVFNNEMKLGGFIDQLNLLEDGTIRIIDLKTGDLTDDNGLPKFEYVVQLAAYEKLCRNIWPDSPIECVLDNGSELIVDITQEIRTDIEVRLAELSQLIDGLENKVVDASVVQSLGQSCFTCPIRFICGAYREKLKDDDLSSLVENGQFGEIKDGYGIVTDVRNSALGRVVNLKTRTGRTIQLRTEFEWQVSKLAIGDAVMFFNFVSKQVKNKASGSLVQPVNFSDSFGSFRNWSAELFVS